MTFCTFYSVSLKTKAVFKVIWMQIMDRVNRDYFMVGKCVRFLFTSCEGSLNERVSAANE